MTTTTLGQRILALRRRRGMNQRQLAEASGVSVDLIRKLEQGQRHSARMDSLTAIAYALDQDLADLLGKPRGLVVGAEDSEMFGLRRAVLDVVTADVEPPNAEELRGRLGEAWRMYWAGRYAPLARELPPRIIAARAGVRAASAGEHTRQAQATLADFLHLAASLLAHLAHDDLAALAMHQALTAATATENQLLIAGLSASRAWLLSRQGLTAEAEHLALATAAEIEPRMSTASVDQVAIWGELLRYACITVARSGRHPEATDLLALVQTAATRVGAERPARPWTVRIADKSTGQTGPLSGLSFGPTLAAITAVSVAAAAERHRDALHLDSTVDHFDTLSPAVRSRHLLTVAWVQMADHRSLDSVNTLLRAERLAPDMLAHQTIALTTIAELLPRRRRQRLPGLVSLAERVGVAAA